MCFIIIRTHFHYLQPYEWLIVHLRIGQLFSSNLCYTELLRKFIVHCPPYIVLCIKMLNDKAHNSSLIAEQCQGQFTSLDWNSVSSIAHSLKQEDRWDHSSDTQLCVYVYACLCTHLASAHWNEAQQGSLNRLESQKRPKSTCNTKSFISAP